MSITTPETTIEADPTVPTLVIVRDFDAPPDRCLRAWTDPELVTQWLGPNSTEMRIDALGGRHRRQVPLHHVAGR